MALELWRDDLIVWVERGEDAEIACPGSGTRAALQIKRPARDVHLEILAVMLTHFGNLRSDGSLLERMASDESLTALFVMGGRCTDELRPLIAGQPAEVLTARSSSPLSGDTVRDLHHLIANRNDGKSELKKRRADGLKKLAGELGVGGLAEVSKRIFILEQVTAARVASMGRERLSSSFRVPWSEAGELFSTKLRALVEETRDQRGDLIPRFRAALAPFGRVFQRPHDIERANEATFFEQIDLRGLLLLAGESQCGKTHFAEKVLQRFQDRGFEYLKTDDVDDAARFLLGGDPKKDRIALLEDPLRKPHALGPLSDLIERRPKHRKLIVTSRVSDIRALGLPKSHPLAEHRWIDLTVREPELIERIWDAVSSTLDATARERVKRLIAGQGGSVFQPGHVVHLSGRSRDSVLMFVPSRAFLLDGRHPGALLGTACNTGSVGTSKDLADIGAGVGLEQCCRSFDLKEVHVPRSTSSVARGSP